MTAARDPLAEALLDIHDPTFAKAAADNLRAILARHGLAVVRVEFLERLLSIAESCTSNVYDEGHENRVKAMLAGVTGAAQEAPHGT